MELSRGDRGPSADHPGPAEVATGPRAVALKCMPGSRGRQESQSATNRGGRTNESFPLYHGRLESNRKPDPRNPIAAFAPPGIDSLNAAPEVDRDTPKPAVTKLTDPPREPDFLASPGKPYPAAETGALKTMALLELVRLASWLHQTSAASRGKKVVTAKHKEIGMTEMKNKGLAVSDLVPGEALVVATRSRTYLLKYLGDDRGLLSGHPEYCRTPTPVRIEGSTWGGSMIEVGQLNEGMSLEFTLSSGAILTTSTVLKISRADWLPVAC